MPLRVWYADFTEVDAFRIRVLTAGEWKTRVPKRVVLRERTLRVALWPERRPAWDALGHGARSPVAALGPPSIASFPEFTG